jgi:hypothetical protein
MKSDSGEEEKFIWPVDGKEYGVSEITNKLAQLLYFKAKLMRDNYSKKFYTAFKKYFEEQEKDQNKESWVLKYIRILEKIDKQNGGNGDWSNVFGLRPYKVSTEHIGLPIAGTYSVKLYVFFDEQKLGKDEISIEKATKISAAVQLIKSNTDILYYMPLDNLIDLEGGKDFGVAYAIKGNKDEFPINVTLKEHIIAKKQNPQTNG